MVIFYCNVIYKKIVEWSALHGLPLNASKCCVIHYAGRHAPNPCVNYCINNVSIAHVDSCVDLGVLREKDGLYKQHIANTAAKASRRVGISMRAFACRDAEFMRRLFVSYIRPQLEYAAVIWSPLDVASITRLELVQRRFTKYITGFYNLSYPERLHRLNLPSLKLRRDLLLLCFMYRVLHGGLAVSHNMFGLSVCNNNTRSAGIKLSVPRPYCSVFKTSFMYRGTHLWNSLPNNVLLSPNLSTFKERVLLHWCTEGAW